MKKRILQAIVTGLVAIPLCLAFAQDEGGAEKGKGKGKGRPEGGPPGGGKGGPPGGRPMGPPAFEDVDADSSGGVSEEELVAAMQKRAAEGAKRLFGFLDKDKDGELTGEELGAMANRGGKGGPPGGEKGKGGKGKGGKGGPPEGGGGGEKPKRPPVDDEGDN
ncbi:MAG: translation initiation factor IF-2 [Verrucomicrobiales bacterium]|jgi:translation initiation factor IF-2